MSIFGFFGMILLQGFSLWASEISSPISSLRLPSNQKIFECKLLIALAQMSIYANNRELGIKPTASHLVAKPLDRPFVLALARETPIYDLEELKRKLDPSRSSIELSKSAKSTMQRLFELGAQRIAVSAARLSDLDHLSKKMPNFAEALEIIKDALQLSIDSGLPIRMPPILLMGDPGIGKTFFASLLAEALGTGSFFISMNGVTGGFVLAGNSQQWEGSKMGRIAESLIYGKNANPIIVLDEVDKVAKSVHHDPMAPLYTLLEEKTSHKFRDEFLDMEINASQVNWIATANNYESIPAPIQSRFLAIEIPRPSPVELRIIMSEILSYSLRTKLTGVKFSNEISDEVFKKLSTSSPRQIQNIMALAVGRARRMGRLHLEASDINMHLLGTSPRTIGF